MIILITIDKTRGKCMSEQKKEYYLKKGRLDLSSLDTIGQENIEEESELFGEPEIKKLPPNIYKDAQIDGILKEMGEYFSSL